tara:strand:- start:879 stop:1151 length:273 start_codon:yes stop_codon:yes gene_type:complete
MKYQAETDAVYDGLVDISELVKEHSDRIYRHQSNEIRKRVNHIKHLLGKRFPLKAKRELKQLDLYIDKCLYIEELPDLYDRQLGLTADNY